MWRDGEDLLCAQVALPEAAGDPDGFGIHPALLDAAVHPALLIDSARRGHTDTGSEPGTEATDGRVWLPFAWNGVSLSAGGATTVRVRLSPQEQEAGGAEGERASAGRRWPTHVGGPVLTVDSAGDAARRASSSCGRRWLTASHERGQPVHRRVDAPARLRTGHRGRTPGAADPADDGEWVVPSPQECGPIVPAAVYHAASGGVGVRTRR
ncbi:hypothetical protein [Streptomyces sp. Mo3]|uniref:hypothetical protein n=1 Tax=Streptomyces sp. Mo3 TaxID=3161190 RepID=UPI0039EE6636